MMLMAQTLFALGADDEAAAATQAAMQMLPEDKWGVVITNYKELYGNIQDFTDQIRAPEKARVASPMRRPCGFCSDFSSAISAIPSMP